MHYYIITKGQDYCIMKVQPDDKASFERLYKDVILFEADSVAALLNEFSQKLTDKPTDNNELQ